MEKAKLTTDTEIIRAALAATNLSYAPYSHFNVGAAVRAASGKVYVGANIENASYGVTNCAERSAIFAAVMAGERKIVALAVAGGANGKVTDYCAPCGVCRQVMREFAAPEELVVYVAKSETDFKTFTLEELLPESFGPDNLSK